MRLFCFFQIASTATLNSITNINETHKVENGTNSYNHDREFMIEYLGLFRDYIPIITKFEAVMEKVADKFLDLTSRIYRGKIDCSDNVLKNIEMWGIDFTHHCDLVKLFREDSTGAEYNIVSEASSYLNTVVYKLDLAIKYNKYARKRYNAIYYHAKAMKIKLPSGYGKMANKAFVIFYEIELWFEQKIAMMVEKIKC
jgi:hypothetical protein